jgi:iron(III) transport system permease protein
MLRSLPKLTNLNTLTDARPLPLPLPSLRGWPTLPRIPWLILAGALVAGLAALPLLYLVIRAVGAGEAGIETLLRPRTFSIVSNSLLLMGAVTLSSALIGVPFAWLTARTDLPYRRVWLVLGLLPMVIPSYLGAIAFAEAFGPRGTLQGLLAPFGVERLPSIYGFTGAWLAITLFSYPYVVLPVRAALMNMDPALEEAARGMGWGAGVYSCT